MKSGFEIGRTIKPTQVLSPTHILFCDSNARARTLADKLALDCTKNVKACEIDLSKDYQHDDDEKYVMLVYLNEDTFCNNGNMLHDSVKHAMDKRIKIVLAHERDMQRGGCPFHEIIAQTPDELLNAPYNIFSRHIVVCVYTEEEYEYVTLCQLLKEIGAKPVRSKAKRFFSTLFSSGNK